jgi:hypothetical protein
MTNSEEKFSPDIDSARDPVPPSEPKPNVEPGPLGKLDSVNPVVPGAAPHPPSGLATMTVVVGFGGLVASLVVLGSVAEGVRSQEVFALDAWATPFLHGIASPELDVLMNGRAPPAAAGLSPDDRDKAQQARRSRWQCPRQHANHRLDQAASPARDRAQEIARSWLQPTPLVSADA